MSAAQKCPKCGAELTGAAFEGLCPACMVQVMRGMNAADANRAAPLGTVHYFGDYELLEEIARGGMGVVFKARQVSLNRTVALKMILTGRLASRALVQRFHIEAEAAANLKHPNIVAIHEVGEHEGQHYFSMDYIEGQSLADRVRQGPMPLPQAASCVQTIAGAIHYAHQRGVLHRDLKPSNILLDAQEDPHITDFGLAKLVEQESSLTQSEAILGTPSYMSPEQAAGEAKQLTTAADIYSLGAIFYELLTGRPPFQASTAVETMQQVREQEPVPPSLVCRSRRKEALIEKSEIRNPKSETDQSLLTSAPTEEVDRDLETICLKCLRKDPEARYSSAEALAEDLARWQNGEPIHARPVGPAEKLWRWCRRKPVVASLGAATLVLLLAVAVGSPIAIFRINHERRRAESNAVAERAERNRAEIQSYASDMNLAQQALAVNNLGRALELLNRHRPAANPLRSSRREEALISKSEIRNPKSEIDLCGWEWRYLWQQTQGDELFTLCQEPIPIFSLAVSPDARFLAVGERNMGHLTVWDLHSRQEVLRLPEGKRPETLHIRAAFSPTEPLLAYGSSFGFSPTSMVTRVRILNFVTREQVAELPHEFLCTGLAFSPDGARLVTSTPNFLTLWDVRTGAKLTNYPFGSHQSIGTPFSITPDFKWVAQAFGSGRVRVFDLTTGTKLWETNASQFRVEAVALSGDGRWLATADAGDESVIRGRLLAATGAGDTAVIKIWNAMDGRLITSFDPSPGGVIQLLFGPDRRTLISAHTDQTIRVWDVSNLASVPPPRALIGHQLEVWRLALMPDGTHLVSGGKDGSVRFWDLTRPPRDRRPVALPDGPFVGWSFSGSESDLLTCDRKGQISRWSGATWQTNEVLLETGQEASTACFLPERHEVVIAGRDFSALHVYRWGDSGQARLLPVFSKEDARDGWKWIVRRHGNRLAVGQVNQPMIHDFDVNTWEMKESWRAPPNIWDLDFTADERTCVMGGYRGQVLVRNMVTGEESSFVDDMPNLGSVAFSKLGDRVAISCEQGFVRLWNAGSWQDAGTLRGFLHAVHGLSFNPDGRRLAAGSSGEEAIRLYEMEFHQPLITLRAEGVGFFPAFDSSGNVLAGMNAAGKLYVWRAPSWAEIEAAERARK